MWIDLKFLRVSVQGIVFHHMTVCLSVISSQLRTQDGTLPAVCFLFGSYLPPGSKTLLMGLQGCPRPRTFGCLLLPGSCRQCLVSLATLRSNHVQVSFCDPRVAFISFSLGKLLSPDSDLIYRAVVPGCFVMQMSAQAAALRVSSGPNAQATPLTAMMNCCTFCLFYFYLQ